jgi:hypothetical protein
MTPKDYERELDQLAVGNLIVHAALSLHESARSDVDLALAMKIMVVELARDNARLLELAKGLQASAPAVIRLCPHGETCPNESENSTSSES